MSFHSYRTIAGWGVGWMALLLLSISLVLLLRGIAIWKQRRWRFPIPGRVWVGSFLFTYAIKDIEVSYWRLHLNSVAAAGVKLNDAGSVIVILLAGVLGFIALYVHITRGLDS